MPLMDNIHLYSKKLHLRQIQEMHRSRTDDDNVRNEPPCFTVSYLNVQEITGSRNSYAFHLVCQITQAWQAGNNFVGNSIPFIGRMFSFFLEVLSGSQCKDSNISNSDLIVYRNKWKSY